MSSEYKKCSVCEVELKDYFWHFTTSQYMVEGRTAREVQGYHGQTLCQECNEAALNALYDRYPYKVIPDFYCPKCSYLHSGVTIERCKHFTTMLCLDTNCNTSLTVNYVGTVTRFDI
jgi:hypothetical protein